jgi:hypothetical protein
MGTRSSKVARALRNYVLRLKRANRARAEDKKPVRVKGKAWFGEGRKRKVRLTEALRNTYGSPVQSDKEPDGTVRGRVLPDQIKPSKVNQSDYE